MHPRLLLLALALAVPLALTGPAAAAPAERATAEQQAANLKLGTRLVNRFWSLLVAGDPDELRAFLSPAFQVQRANGSGQNRNQYLADFANSTTVISDYSLSRIKVTRAGGLVVVRYYSQSTQTISGTAYSTTPAPRIVTFVQTPSGWRMASNANFNAP
ncbi:MAG: nuclear transport factor 2 family protein [Actinobacteria bacterium]|nr:nuclear transport factor 2 family protein [Actinomycetota bacterium]